MSHDLRTAMKCLEHQKEIVQLDSCIDVHNEIAGLYRYLGAGGAVMRPTKVGPALLCTNLKDFPDRRILIGMNSRRRLSKLLDCPQDALSKRLAAALQAPVEPNYLKSSEGVDCYTNYLCADEPDFDIRKILPAPCNTEDDAGPFITMGMLCASDPETGERDITIHRVCLQSRDEMTISFAPGRHIDAFRQKAERAGRSLPVSISIGYDPIIALASCFQAPTTPLGFNELTIAGSLRHEAVDMVPCRSIREYAIAGSEFIIEGELLPFVRMPEDVNTRTGKAMPEFTGYEGVAEPALPVMKVKAVAFRKDPIIQICIGASNEHVALAGPPTEASIWIALQRALPGKVLNVYAPPGGGGKFMLIIQVKKESIRDEGIQRQAALVAFATFKELKHIYLVDEDVDPFDMDDVLWAMNTRFQGDLDTIMIPGTRMHHIDPSSWPEYSPFLRERGQACKMIFDCTVPFSQKERFKRARFTETDLSRYTFKPC